MLCEECNSREARFAVTMNVNGESVVRHLCPECMRAMKEKPWKDVAGYGVSAVEDYASGICTFDDGSETCLTLPRSNMIRYLFENGDWIVVRPSGTEPKLKLYVGAGDADEQKLDEKLESMKTDCDGRLRKALGL